MTPLIKLRPVMLADYEALSRLRADLELQHLLLANPPPAGDLDVAGWIERRKNSGMIWTIAEILDDTCVGFVQITSIHNSNRYAYVGIAIERDKRGAGRGEAAMIALVAKARALRLRKLLLEVRVDNSGAIAMYEKLGFYRVGVMLRHYDDGERSHDVLLMECQITYGDDL